MVSVMLYHCMFCVALSMEPLVCVSDSLCKLFGETCSHV